MGRRPRRRPSSCKQEATTFAGRPAQWRLPPDPGTHAGKSDSKGIRFIISRLHIRVACVAFATARPECDAQGFLVGWRVNGVLFSERLNSACCLLGSKLPRTVLALVHNDFGFTTDSRDNLHTKTKK